jgi:hypothetical protein
VRLARQQIENTGVSASAMSVAVAILARVIHNAYRIELACESLRKRPPSA